jgi:hypothetical protein
MTIAVLFRALIIIAIALATSAATCLQPKTPVLTTDAGVSDAKPTFLDCTSDNVWSIAQSMQGDIASAVASDNYEVLLAALVAKFTIGEVKCAVEIWLGGNQRKAASADALVRLEVSRAQGWVSSH